LSDYIKAEYGQRLLSLLVLAHREMQARNEREHASITEERSQIVKWLQESGTTLHPKFAPYLELKDPTSIK
jgi:hypothetical protein